MSINPPKSLELRAMFRKIVRRRKIRFDRLLLNIHNIPGSKEAPSLNRADVCGAILIDNMKRRISNQLLGDHLQKKMIAQMTVRMTFTMSE